jgi:hypothetical protein
MAESTRELPYPEIDIDAVRKHVNGRANSSSVREVARQIGIRNTSLDKFLNGSVPYARNRALLCEWYIREHRTSPIQQAEDFQTQREDASPETLLEALLKPLRGEARAEARLKITQALGLGYSRMGLPEPEWLSGR